MGVMENAALLRNTPSLELKAEDEGKRGEYLRWVGRNAEKKNEMIMKWMDENKTSQGMTRCGRGEQ